jgi:hypothetical protein
MKAKFKITAKPSAPVAKAPAPTPAARTPRTPRVRENAKHANREDYLEAAVDIFSEWFAMAGSVELPAVRVSCGFHGGRGSKKWIGSCWDANAAKDKKSNIFISPLIDDSLQVLATLAHELVHAVLGHKEGHGAKFKSLALLIGLRGKMTATYAGTTLENFIRDEIVAKEGNYPHAALSLLDNPTKKQGTRLIKCICKTSGYTVRTTRTWIEKCGAPISPVDKQPMAVIWPAGEEPKSATDLRKEVAA